MALPAGETTCRTSAPRRTMKRLVLGVASLFTAWHLFATFLWIAPPSALRDVVPGNALSNYMIPFFGQSWSVFAPEPINGDFYFDVRAVLDEGNGELSTTDWKRATDVEQSRSEYNLFPPRSSNLGVAVASNLKDSWDQLNEDQRAVVALGYFKGSDWQDR